MDIRDRFGIWDVQDVYVYDDGDDDNNNNNSNQQTGMSKMVG